MAKIDPSRLMHDGGGYKPPTETKAPTSGAVGNQFKPYVTPAPTTSSAFVGPIPATATRTTTGYKTDTGTKVTPAPTYVGGTKVTPPSQAPMSPGPSNLPYIPAKIDKFEYTPPKTKTTAVQTPVTPPKIKPPTSASSTATSNMPEVILKKPKPDRKLITSDVPNSLKLPTSENATATSTSGGGMDLKKLGGELLFGTESFKGAGKDIGAIFTGKDEFGNKKNRAQSFIEGLGNASMGAFNALSTASLIVPVIGEGSKAANLAVNAAVRGGKLAVKNAATTAAAVSMAASPVTHAASAGKATTAITQSVDAARAAANAGTKTFTPKVVKEGTKDVVKNVEAVATKTKAGVQGNTGAQVLTAAGAAEKAGAYAAGKDNATKVKTPETTETKAETKADATTNDTVKGGGSYVSPTKGSQFKAWEAANGIDNAKGGDVDKTKAGEKVNDGTGVDNTTNFNNPWDFNYNYNNNYVRPIIDDVKIAEETPVGEGGVQGEDPAKLPEKPARLPKRVPLPDGKEREKEEMKRKRRWVPSAIV